MNNNQEQSDYENNVNPIVRNAIQNIQNSFCEFTNQGPNISTRTPLAF